MEHLVGLTDALAWPIASIIIALAFRSEIRKLLPSIKKFKAGPIEAEFERRISEVIAESTDLILDSTTTQEVVSVNDKLVKLADVDPRSAILETWRNLETSLKGAVIKRSGSPIPDVSTSFKILREAEKMELLSPSELLAANELRGLRNQAAHIENFNPTRNAALKYIELAKRVERHAKLVVEGNLS